MAIIGLLSDSHGRAETTRLAVERLRGAGAEILIHLGDIEAPEVLDAMVVEGAAGATVAAHVVFGNADHEWAELARHARAIGLVVAHPVGRLEVDFKTVMFLHGNDPQAMSWALAQQPDYVCHGHTHQASDMRLGRTRIISPGALFRARPRTAAVLDVAGDEVSLLNLDVASSRGEV